MGRGERSISALPESTGTPHAHGTSPLLPARWLGRACDAHRRLPALAEEIAAYCVPLYQIGCDHGQVPGHSEAARSCFVLFERDDAGDLCPFLIIEPYLKAVHWAHQWAAQEAGWHEHADGHYAKDIASDWRRQPEMHSLLLGHEKPYPPKLAAAVALMAEKHKRDVVAEARALWNRVGGKAYAPIQW